MVKLRGGKVRRGGRRKSLVHRIQKSNQRREGDGGAVTEVDGHKEERRDADGGERMTTTRSRDDDEAVGGDKSEDEVVGGGGIETAAKEATTAKEATAKNNDNSSQAIGDENNLEEKAYNVWLEESDPDDVDFVVETEDVENGEVKDRDIEEEFVTQRAKKGKRKRKKTKSGKRNTMSDSVDSSSNSDEDEEDLVERFQFEVEEDVAMFVDEFSRGRREIPESDAEDEDPMVERSRRIRRGS